MTDDERPQDAGRRHRRKGQHSPATTLLLAEYQEAMRRELRGLLAELGPAEAEAPQLGLDGKPIAPTAKPLTVRSQLWDLAIKLGRELGSAIDADPAPTTEDGSPAAPPRRGRLDFGGK